MLTVAGVMTFAATPAVKFFLSIVTGFPLALFYRKIVAKHAPLVHHFYFIIVGLSIAYFNFRYEMVHFYANIMLVHLLIQVCGGTKFSVFMAFFINMGYLLTGYYFHKGLEYSITWTTPQCVLCLRLIGLVFDLYDGAKPEEKLSLEQKENCLRRKPSLIETLAYCYYFPGFLVGPQFAMRRYLELVNAAYRPENFSRYMKLNIFKNFVLGIVYIVVYQISQIYLPDDFLLSPYYENNGFLRKCLLILVWGKFHVYKYLACWNMAEGSCRLTGLGYQPLDGSKKCVKVDVTGMDWVGLSAAEKEKLILKGLAQGLIGGMKDDATGREIITNDDDVEVVNKPQEKKDDVVEDDESSSNADDWTPVSMCADVCSNIKALDFELASTCTDLVQSFNINTNKWMSRYIFKRCKGLNNKTLSHLITLNFLALWHGFFSGYFVNFAIEFFTVKLENDLGKIRLVRRMMRMLRSLGVVGDLIIFTVRKIHIQMVLSYALVAFSLFTYPRYMKVYSQVYYFVFVSHFLVWSIINPFIPKIKND